MEFNEYFTRYGSRTDYAEIRTYNYLRKPETIENARDIAHYDKSAENLISECEALIKFSTEYRKRLAARYAALETMPYKDVLKLERKPHYSGGIYYDITISRIFEDGSKQELLFEHRTGKQRREAISRFEELKKQRPGIEAVKDIEKRAWER